jgi:HK97 family phage portal protein
VRKVQLPDNSLAYQVTRRDGTMLNVPQEAMFNLTGLTLDGIHGVSVLTFAREAIGLSLAQEQHGAGVFKRGANVSAAFTLPAGRTLTDDQYNRLKAELEEFRNGGSRDGDTLVLEDGLTYQQMALTAKDAEWLASREFSRVDVCMFFGVPPHLVGITAGNTQLGSSIETQSQGFVTYSLEDSFTGWEEAIGLQLLAWDKNPALYARFNRNALVRGDINTRWTAYVKAMQWGVMSPNEVRALEDMNPRADGDIYYPPPNTAGNATGDNHVPA